MVNQIFPSSDIILYISPEVNIKVEVVYSGDTFGLNQKRMAELFGVDRTVITKHLQNIFFTNELTEVSVCAIFAHTVYHDCIKAKSIIQKYAY